MSGARSRRLAGAMLAVVLIELVAALASAPMAGAFDPGQVANTAGDPAFNTSIASQFQLNLENLTACAWRDCNVTQSDAVRVNITGADRLTGSFVERYHIEVSGVDGFATNYTTIAVVLKGNTSDVVLQPDAGAERSGVEAYTKNLNGSSTMDLTLLPSNRTGNVTMYVFGYVGEGNRSTHGAREYYQVAKKDLPMRALRTVPVNVTVANDANVSVTNVLVSFMAKGPADADYKPIGNTTLTAVNAKGQADAGVVWDVTWADAARYTVKVVVDPLHAHADAFEDNNVYFFEVNLGPPPPPESPAVGRVFLWVTLGVIVAIGAGLWWYNRVYE